MFPDLSVSMVIFSSALCSQSPAIEQNVSVIGVHVQPPLYCNLAVKHLINELKQFCGILKHCAHPPMSSLMMLLGLDY